MAKNTASRSQMTHQFREAPQARIPRSSFNRSHGLKTTLDGGYLVPIFLDEVLPGDTHSLRASLFGRMATPLKPFMDNLFMETFFFFVPTRLIWDNWQRFNGEKDNPDDTDEYVIPFRNINGSVAIGSLADYLGVPVGTWAQCYINDLPFRCYNLIWNEWFRDQNLQDSASVNKGDTALSLSEYPIRRRGKRHDYFTSCLPWPQKGDPVTVPLGQYAEVIPGNIIDGAVESSPSFKLFNGTSQGNLTQAAAQAVNQTQQATGQSWWDDPALIADLQNATGFTINQLREAFQIQKLLERDARGGTRYTEIIRSHFGVTSPDARLQRPEFLGGGSSMVNINPVQQTSGTAPQDGYTPTPQGNLAAYGTVSGHNHGFTKSFTEHGYILGLVNFRAELTYQQGLNRLWSRRGRYDFYWPALAHIGEQAVLNKEIYFSGDANSVIDDAVFGYQERYAEYRYKPSQITGLFRSASPTSLDYWHLAQDFDSLPVLGDEFIQDTPPIDRVVAVPSEPDFLLDVWFNLRSVRPMPVYGVPGLIDHF